MTDTNHRRDNDAPKADKAYRKWMDGLAGGLLQIGTYQQTIQEEKPTLVEFRVKCDPDDEKGVLVIVKGYLGAEWYVAFHRAETVGEAVQGLGNRLRNGSLKWKEDVPYGDR